LLGPHQERRPAERRGPRFPFPSSGRRRSIDSYSALYENDRTTPTGLTGYLRERGITRLFLAGLALDFCVRYSAEDAVREGFVVVVVEDACRGIDVQGSVAAARSSLAALKASRITAGELSAFLDMGD
jgi:nicotinamidase/pyrazinamidase